MLRVAAQGVLAFLIDWYLKKVKSLSDLMLIQEVNGQKRFDSKKTFWKTIPKQLFIRWKETILWEEFWTKQKIQSIPQIRFQPRPLFSLYEINLEEEEVNPKSHAYNDK